MRNFVWSRCHPMEAAEWVKKLHVNLIHSEAAWTEPCLLSFTIVLRTFWKLLQCLVFLSVHSPTTANSVEFVSLACNLSVHSYLRRAKCMRVPIYRIFLSVPHLLMTRFVPRLLGGTLWKFVVFIIIELAEPSFLAVLSSCCMQPCVYILGNSSTASSFAFAEPMNLPTPEPVRLRNLPFLFVDCYRVLIILIQNTTLRRTESLSTIHPTQSLPSSEWRLVAEGNGQLAGKGENYDDDVRMAKSGNVFVRAINILKFYSNGIPFCYYTSCPSSSSRVPKILLLLLLFSPLSDMDDDDDDERKFILPTLHRKLISCKHTHNSSDSAIWMKRCDAIHFNCCCCGTVSNVTINSGLLFMRRDRQSERRNECK